MADFQSTFKKAYEYAALKHQGQKLPGTKLPYLVHVTNVAIEVLVAGMNTNDFDLDFGVSVALLHDVMEDTEANYLELKDLYGERIAEGVLALTKFSNLEKSEQMENSLDRIKMLEKEIWAVKLADRLINLQAPSLEWTPEKRKKYLQGSENILSELAPANEYLALRLKAAINEYISYVITGEK